MVGFGLVTREYARPTPNAFAPGSTATWNGAHGCTKRFSTTLPPSPSSQKFLSCRNPRVVTPTDLPSLVRSRDVTLWRCGNTPCFHGSGTRLDPAGAPIWIARGGAAGGGCLAAGS